MPLALANGSVKGYSYISPRQTTSRRIWGSHTSGYEEQRLCFPHDFTLVFARLILRPWIWRQNVPPKRRLTFNGLHGFISQKTVSFRPDDIMYVLLHCFYRLLRTVVFLTIDAHSYLLYTFCLYFLTLSSCKSFSSYSRHFKLSAITVLSSGLL
jgi:hypothetical protein